MVKNMPANVGDIKDAVSIPGLGKIPWRRAWQATPVFLPGESHRQRSLLGCTVHRVTNSQTQLKRRSVHSTRAACYLSTHKKKSEFPNWF